MRVDGKIEGPRQSMSWLHTWASLILGWLLYAIFLTGTLSFFQTEISVWMKPEFHQSIPSQSNIQQTQVALAYLQKNHPNAGSWSIQLPNTRQNTTTLNIRQLGENPKARRGGQRITIDSQTGEVLEARETRGGSFLYRFHFELYGLPRIWARWIVGIATMFMLVAIISGIITHKKIFKDFFTFRPGKGQRSWLDAHNATAVFALPFHIMITFSGLLLLMFTLMPWGINQVYENRGQFLQEQRKSMLVESDHPHQQNLTSVEKSTSSEHDLNGTQSKKNSTIDAAQLTKIQAGVLKKRVNRKSKPAPLTDLQPIMLEAERHWKSNPVSTITITAPNTNKAKIELRALNVASIAHRGMYETLEFNGVTGKNITDESAQLKNPSIPNGIYNVITTLHEARGVDLALRWLLFLSGVLGTIMVASGLIMWCVKRAPQQQKQGFKSFGYRVVEVTNITAIMGLPLACAAYFYANRLIPSDMHMRSNWEIRSFFIVWGITFLYAIVRTHRQAWLELLAFASLAFACLPILNFMTGGQPLWASITHDQWMIASFDLAMLVLACLFTFSFKKVKQHKGLPTKKGKLNSMMELDK